MGSKTTYYLGAGASAKALPCVANMHDKITEMISFIENNQSREYSFSTTYIDSNQITQRVNNEDLYYLYSSLSEKINNIIAPLRTSLSIDTYAKVLYLKGAKNEYLALKAVLVAAFVYWEKSNPLDNRYENFWATIAIIGNSETPGLSKFSNEINIVSWNYDYQLESSLAQIIDGTGVKLETSNSVFGLIDIIKTTGIEYLKLNGYSSLSSKRQYFWRSTNFHYKDISNSSLASLLASIISFPERFMEEINMLKFCWEEREEEDYQKFRNMKLTASETSTLVVIGYTFPSINHPRDKEILGAMRLRNVYFQGKDKADSIRIMDSFKAVYNNWSNVNLNPIESTGFFIPPEATLPEPVSDSPGVYFLS